MADLTNSVLQTNSRYVQGGITEVGPIGLEVWNRFTFPYDTTDEPYTVEQKFSGRIDLIADHFYNDWTLWWFIAQYNGVLDPYAEIVEGVILNIPTKARLQNLFIQKSGGIATKRNPETILPPIVL